MNLTGCNAVLDWLGFAVLVLVPFHPGGHDTDRDQGLLGQWLGLVDDKGTVVNLIICPRMNWPLLF